MKSILIVDDNLVSLRQIAAQLQDSYEISLAKSGELALQICAHEKPDLILLDMEMPGMNGLETLARLRQDPSLAEIPVIFLSGASGAGVETKCLEAGAEDFISKTAHGKLIRYRIETQLEYAAHRFHPQRVVSEMEDALGFSFAELVECKDRNAAGHIARVSRYAELLGQDLLEQGCFGAELKAEDIPMIRRAAPFHDIGKIGISDLVLLKRGPLTDEERREVHRHTIIGGQMLDLMYSRAPHLPYLKMAKVIAEGHHERYNGEGYPRGLKGDQIPLCCRIMAAANVYDSCVTDRVYRKGLSHETACGIIRDGRGTEFDPRVADAFERLRDAFAVEDVRSKQQIKSMGWSVFHETDINS